MEVRVLVACEFSGNVRDAFRALGHDAWSCDLLPCPKGPRWHIQEDVSKLLDPLTNPSHGFWFRWDLMIAHPPCDYLTNSAAWAYGDGPYHQKVKPETLVGERRRVAREEAIKFFALLLNAPIERIAIENPIGVISSRIRKPDQIIQPNEFGADASKATCLWLKGLPPLAATKLIEPRFVCCDDTLPNGLLSICPQCNGSNKPLPRWANQTDSGQNRLSPSDDRAQVRAITYPGIAKAMAEQWGGIAQAQRKVA